MELPNAVQARADALRFCQGLTAERLARAREHLDAIAPPQEAVYRHLHHSFKQYGRFQMGIHSALLAMAALVGNEDPADPLAVLEAQGLNPWTVAAARKALVLRWTMERNEEASWLRDMAVLASAWLQVTEVARATVEAVERMVNGEGFLWAEYSSLDYTDALFLEASMPLGAAYRGLDPHVGHQRPECEGTSVTIRV